MILGIALFSGASWLALDWGARRLSARLPAFRIDALHLHDRQVGVTGLMARHGSADARVHRLAIDFATPLAPILRVEGLRVTGPASLHVDQATAAVEAGRIALAGAGRFNDQPVDLRGQLDPFTRRVTLEGVEGPAFNGVIARRPVRVERITIDPAGLHAVDAAVIDRRGTWSGGTVHVERAPCGWGVTVEGGQAWIPMPEASDRPADQAPSRSTVRVACMVRGRDIQVLAHTPAGVRSATLDAVRYDDGVLLASGRLAGAQGEVLLPRDAEWAVAWGSADLQAIAVLLKEDRVTGHVRGRLDVLRSAGRLELGARGRLNATLHHPAVAEAPVVIEGLEFDVSAERVGEAFAAEAHRLTLGGVTATGRVQVTPDTVDLSGHLEPTDCQTLWDAIPAALRGPYAKARLHGALAPRVRFHLPRADAFKLTFDWEGSSECFVDALNTDESAQPPATVSGSRADVDWLLRDFRLPVQYASRPVEVGPGTPSYVPIAELPAWVPSAAIVSEDNAFNRGHAINLGLLRRALMFNLDRGRYVYGGSTIPQQLVKNLFLTRRKTLARKLQEAIVALRLVDVVPKRRILELYLNCIEFAPNVYGIERAARHYFQRGARQLTPKQAAFLATAKPSPRYAAAMRRRGRTPETAHFQEYMRRIIERMRRRGAITAAQAADSAPYRLRWRSGRIIDERDSPRADGQL